jgi:hypothetical protein
MKKSYLIPAFVILAGAISLTIGIVALAREDGEPPHTNARAEECHSKGGVYLFGERLCIQAPVIKLSGDK